MTHDKAVCYALERLSSLNHCWKCLYTVSHLLRSYLQRHTYVCKEEKAREKDQILAVHTFRRGLVGLMPVLLTSSLFTGASPGQVSTSSPFFLLTKERTGAPPRAHSG